MFQAWSDQNHQQSAVEAGGSGEHSFLNGSISGSPDGELARKDA